MRYIGRLAPDRQEHRIGLGAALCRAGQYREAIESLGRADRLDKGSPAVLAFLAMAHHQLGQRAQARADLARLRELLEQPNWGASSERLLGGRCRPYTALGLPMADRGTVARLVVFWDSSSSTCATTSSAQPQENVTPEPPWP